MDEVLEFNDMTASMRSDETAIRVPLDVMMRLLDAKRDGIEVLDELAGVVQDIADCDHVFISRYRATEEEFESVAWRSDKQPSTVPLKQKFMGEKYLNLTLVDLGDVAQHNHRLRPEIARQGFKSMLGFPLTDNNGLLGVMECFSREACHFTPELKDQLLLLARHAAGLLINAREVRLSRRLLIENEFLHDVQKNGYLSDGLVLYRLGEAMTAILEPDGIAVFGLETGTASEILQEVMAKGFTMNDIYLLKQTIDMDFINRLKQLPKDGEKTLLFRHPIGDKLLYIVPLVWENKTKGVIVYFWRKVKPASEISILEDFVVRIVQYIGITLKRNAIYYNIQRVSFNDGLTELTNRRLFDYLLGREFAKAKNQRTPLSLLVVDIDFFKKINDTYGHQTGDEILVQLARVLKQEFRAPNIPARYGGEEFVVILPGVRSGQAIEMAEKLRQKVSVTPFGNDGSISATISVGVSTIHEAIGRTYANPTNLFKAADKAVYKAKGEGRNRVVAD